MADYLTYAYLLAKSYTTGLSEAEKWEILCLRMRLGL